MNLACRALVNTRRGMCCGLGAAYASGLRRGSSARAGVTKGLLGCSTWEERTRVRLYRQAWSQMPSDRISSTAKILTVGAYGVVGLEASVPTIEVGVPP